MGSVISTYSVAETGKISENSSPREVANAINENSKRITAVEEELTTKADEAYVDSLQNVTRSHSKDIKALSEGIRDNVLPAIEANRSDIDANTAAIGKLKDLALKADKDAVAENRKNIDKNTSRITGIYNKQGLQDIRLNNHSERITAVEEGLTTKADEAYVDSLQNVTRNHTQNIKALSEGIRDNVLPAIEANRSDIDNLGNTVNDLGDAVITLDEHLAGTQDAVAENRKDIDALKETQTYKHLSKVENLVKDKADKTELAAKADKTELAAKADKTELAAKADKTELAAKADKTELAAKADKTELAAKADKTELAAKADKTELAAKADKTELANKADKNSVYSKSETDNKFALKADNSVVSAQAVDINNLRTDVNAHKVDINKLRTDVNTHTKRLDHLDNRVNKLDKDLKRGLASQAALTGLFQPYTVGKANFTAAVGGYKSQTAVAVGTGYRYNQNIATKAGVAFTQGGGVTYNAGVNFEW